MNTESYVIVIDHGNTATKVTLFCGDKVVAASRQDAPMVETVAMLCARYPVSGAVYCTVVGVDIRFVETVRCLLAPAKMLVLTHSTPLPLGVRYGSRPTLGMDRVAAAAGAAAMFPGRRCVIVDAGTALTLDLMSAAPEFRGGNISAGLKMRLRALHIFTGRLPQVEAAGRLPEIGDDTETALRCGAVRGIIAEIRDMAAIAGPEAQILLTGGDSLLLYENLDTSMQRRTAVVPDLVARGLLSIFRYNENN